MFTVRCPLTPKFAYTTLHYTSRTLKVSPVVVVQVRACYGYV